MLKLLITLVYNISIHNMKTGKQFSFNQNNNYPL